MPVAVELNEAERVVVFTYSDPWTMQDIRVAHGIAYDYYEDAPQPLCYLVDYRASQTRNPDIINLRHSSPNLWHPNCLMGVVVGGPEVGKQQVSIMEQMGIPGAQRLHFVDTMEEAWSLLRQALASAGART